MQFINLIYEAFCKSLIRFWDNRFIKNDEVGYYRMQIEQLRLENKEIQDRLFNVLSPKTPVEMNDSDVDWQPITSRYETSSLIRKRLEEKSKQRAIELEREARTALGRSTSDLEKELEID